jgi:hypothetical protein
MDQPHVSRGRCHVRHRQIELHLCINIR